MYAIISDIHSNLTALQAVLDDIDQKGIKEIFCLGDIVGYGPEPKECLDLIIDRQIVSIMGNHDHAVFYEPTNFNTGAERASYWTRQELETEPDLDKRTRRWSFLGHLPVRLQMGSILMVHGSPRRPVNEYVFPDDIYTNTAKLMAIFERVEYLCFVGHTHVPGVFLDDPDFYGIDELDYVYPLHEKEKAIVNVGSVGQPRDQDIRASYVIVREDKVEFVRVNYDIERTASLIIANPSLDKFEGERLRDGR
ncbi:MAG: metallophosphoesterase family protein, partial [Sedimentisphaerales bacterium]|nr:metallophosphoesterase family protein [Sedimentisphaerales bacterium]